MLEKDIQQEIEKLKDSFTIPQIRKLAKGIAQTDYKTFLDENPKETVLQRLLYAFVLGYAKDSIQTLLQYFEAFIPYVQTWEVNDSLCQAFKIARRYPEEVFGMLMQYRDSTKEFEVRVVAVTLLSHFLTDAYIHRVLEVLNALNTDAYYSRMGVAWAVATAMGKYPEKCMAFMRASDNRLDAWTYNKSLQKMRESYRVPDEIKQLTKGMKR